MHCRSLIDPFYSRYRAHTMSGTPLGSPLDSPDPQLTFSLVTLDSQQRQVSAPSFRHSSLALLPASSYRSHLNMLVEEREKTEIRVSFDVQTNNSESPIPRPVRGPLSSVWKTAPTPETPSANLSPADSQTFSSHFVSESSLDHHDVPAPSPSAQLTPDGGDNYESDESAHSPCGWESFEADLALANLDIDPSYKHAVEERIFLPDDPLLPRVVLPEKPTPPAYLEL